MAFNIKLLASHIVGGEKVHVYKTPDTAAATIADGYFNGARDESRILEGEPILLVCVTGGTRVVNWAVFQAVPAVADVTIVQADTLV